MKTWLPIVLFTLLRLAVFIVPLLVLVLFGVTPWIAAIWAAVIGMAVSLLVLNRFRNPVAERLHDSRTKQKAAPGFDEESDLENAALDAAERDQE